MTEEEVIEEESELEEFIEDEKLEDVVENVEEESPEVEINDNQFREFIQPSTEAGAPILERIADAPEITPPLQGVVGEEDDRREEGVRYATASQYTQINEDEERREYSTDSGPPILRPRDQEGLQMQELLDPLKGLTNQNTMNQKHIEPEIVDIKRRRPFERDEKKYKKFEFR